MRHDGRERSPRHPSCADACPTGKPTVRDATVSASVWSTVRGHAARKWYAADQREEDRGGEEPAVADVTAAADAAQHREAEIDRAGDRGAGSCREEVRADVRGDVEILGEVVGSARRVGTAVVVAHVSSATRARPRASFS